MKFLRPTEQQLEAIRKRIGKAGKVSFGMGADERKKRDMRPQVGVNCHECERLFYRQTYPSSKKTIRSFCSKECFLVFKRRQSCNLANIKAPTLDTGERDVLLRRCKGCGETFKYMINGKKDPVFCSNKCKSQGQHNGNWGGGKVEIMCGGCGKPFLAWSSQRVHCSKQCYARFKSASMADQTYTRGRGGRREDLGGLFVRSAWEANWARYLNWLKSNGQIVNWHYEPETFEFKTIKRGTRFYTPDFKVLENNGAIVYHEVKGWMDPRSETKLKRMRRFYPGITIMLIDKAAYLSIDKQLGRQLPYWESFRGRKRVSPEQVRNGEALELVRKALV